MQQKQTRHAQQPIRYSTNANGPDGGGGGGAGYGGGGGGSGGGGGAGGVRTVGAAAPPPQQQDKQVPPPPLTIPHPNHMLNAYHSARPPGQPPSGVHHSFIHYTTPLRPQPRHAAQIQTRPAPAATIIPFVQFPDAAAMNQLCGPFPYSPPVPVPLMYSSNAGTSDTGRAQPPPGSYPQVSWTNSAQPSVALMAQPQPAQPTPQQQPQAQPSPYQQYAAYLPPRVHPGYNPTGGAASSAAAAGMQQAPPSTVLMDSRPLPPQQQTIIQKKSTRNHRIPIIHPVTGIEIDVEEKSGGNGSGSSLHLHQDHSGGGHPHLQHSSSNQMSSSAGNAHIAADFAKQVAQVAMNNETPPSRPPREEEPQVNGPASVALGPSPVMLEESSVPTSKRPPGPTPVVSAQAEGTTYDIQSIRSNSSRNVEIRSGESSPARSKAPSQSAPAPVVVQSEVVTHVPVTAPAPQIIPTPIQIQEPQPQPPPSAEPPKQQRRPRVVPEKLPQQQQQQSLQPKPPSSQVEEKEEDTRSRTPSSITSRTPVIKEEETIVKQVVTPVVKTPPVPLSKPTPSDTVSAKPQPHAEKQPTVVSSAPSQPVPPPPVEKTKPIEKKPERNLPVEKPVEKVVAEPAIVIEKQVTVVEPTPVEPPRITKVIEKRAVSPATTVTAPPAPKTKTTFAEGFSLEAMKMTAKAATAAAQTATQTSLSQQQQSSEQSDNTESSHAPVKTVSRSKPKTKQKMREMNQKGVEKEGTDMDAFVDTRPVPTPLLTDNNNRTTSNDSIANKQQNSDISNRTAATTIDSNKDNRNSVDNALRPGDVTTRSDSNIKNDRDKSPAAAEADATNNNSINNQLDLEIQFVDAEDADDMVAAKNEENMKKSSSLADTNSTDSSQVISAPPPSQSSLKYQYKEDQWSPLNPQGKKVYDRDFLMKLREDPLSIKKPDIMAELEIYVKDRDTVGQGGGAGGVRRMGSHSHSSYSVSGFSSSGGSMRGGGNNGLYPDFLSRSLQRMPPKRNSQGGGGNRGPGGGGGRSLKMYNNSLSMRDDYKLNQSENAWKPSKMLRGQESKTKEEREINELYKKVRGILNKLTPQKFDTLVLQFQNLPISNLERMQGTIRLVFEKAVDEPAFSVSYAQLCKFLAKLQVAENQAAAQAAAAAAAQAPQDQNQQPKAQPPQSINFRKILITRCQQEFETNKKLEMDFEKRQQDINECPDHEKRKELQFLFNEEERKIRMRSVGLVTFIGELFKLKMLTANIMHGCIKQLLGKIDEESLECLCKLLTTIGKEFEEQISNKSGGGLSEFNDYFVQMAKLSRKHEGSKVSSRVRFMLQDVIELRQNNWVPRRDENKPKTMAQIQEEVQRESEKAAILASQPLRTMSQNMNQDRQRRNNTRGGNVQSGDDGWSVVAKYPRSSYATEPNKIQGLKSAAGQELEGKSTRGEGISLAPQGYNRWSVGTVSRPMVSSNSFTDNNVFSVLESGEKKPPQGLPGSRTNLKSQMSDDKDKDKEKALQTVSHFYKASNNSYRNEGSRERDSSRGRGGPTGGSPSPSLSGPPSRKPQEPMKRPTEGIGARSDSSRESTPALSSHTLSSAPPAEKQPTRDSAAACESTKEIITENLPQCANTIVQEYISFHNLQESIESFKERFEFTTSYEIFISTCLEFILEQTKEDKRLRTSQLLGELARHQLYPASLLVSEIEKQFEYIYDLEVDIPHVWKYMGEIFGQLILLEVVDFSHFKQVTNIVPASPDGPNKIHLILREIFRILLFEKIPLWFKEKWDSSNVQLSDFIVDKKILDEFLTEYSFLEGKEVSLRDSSIPYDKLQEKLFTFLKASTYNFDQICSWLTLNVGKRINDPMFIRQLTEAVIKASIFQDKNENTHKLDKELLHRNTSLIKRYVDYKEELELWCLYTVQHLVVVTLESPYGMLVDIFQELYESMAISPEGFNKWKQEGTLCQGWQSEGRGVAIAVSNSFFTHMNEVMNDEHEDDDLPS